VCIAYTVYQSKGAYGIMGNHKLIGTVVVATLLMLVVPASSQTFDSHAVESSTLSSLPLATLNADVTNLTVYGPTPYGVRVDVAFKGRLQGALSGTMEGVDSGTVRADGVTDVNVRAKIVTDDQALIAVEIVGNLNNGRVTDTHVRFLTAAPQYAWLTDKIIVGKGFATTEKLGIKYFVLN
jgi:Tfp pilus assembly protein FimT